MINTNYNSSFPDQVVPDAEKATYEYGLQVGRAIEGEWFRNDITTTIFIDLDYTQEVNNQFKNTKMSYL